jgi:hypothetical protein
VLGDNRLIVQQKVSDQPVVGFDWNREKQGLSICCSLDQKARVLIVTRLNKMQ